ncbi:MAG TPA: hypothetical protein ENJ54_07225 [Chloroflexi bacterium]|nr:hypothetical protein [Chloroflexota bacterium]
MTTIQSEEAQEALRMVRETQRQMRRMIAAGGAAYYLWLWGAIWMLGFGVEYFLGAGSPTVGWVWTGLDTLGFVLSMAIGWHFARRLRSPRGTSMGLFWAAWLVYGALIIYFAQPQDANRLTLLIALFVMLAYVITGVLYRSRFFVSLGIALTVLTLVGFVFFPGAFSLWMAVVGGGGLILAGVYIWWAWR